MLALAPLAYALGVTLLAGSGGVCASDFETESSLRAEEASAWVAEPPRLAPPVPGWEGHELSVHTGTFGVFDAEVILEVGAEFRFRPCWHGIRPVLGGSVLEDGGNYGYAGIRREFDLSRRWRVSPSFAAGIYSPGGIDLGGPLEFRSSIEVSYRLFGEFWLGLDLYHLSNGGLYAKNRGSEALLFTLAYGL